MAELGFMESLALGYIAAGSGLQTASAAAGVLNDLQHKRGLAQADADYAALVNEYNALVDRFWHVYQCAKDWEAEGTLRSERNNALQQELAAANNRATAAEQRVATLEQWGESLAVREAEARRDATFYEEQYRSVCDILTAHATSLDAARAEIARLEATIAGMRKADDQGAPTSDTPAP